MRAGRHGRASVSHPRGRLRRGADPWLGHPALARQERAGPLQPTPRIAPVVGVFRNPGHHKWMQRLQQQCPQPADKHQTSMCTRRIGRSRRTSGGPVSRGCEPDWSAPPARQPCRTGCDPGAPAPCARLRRRSPGSGLLSTANGLHRLYSLDLLRAHPGSGTSVSAVLADRVRQESPLYWRDFHPNVRHRFKTICPVRPPLDHGLHWTI